MALKFGSIMQLFQQTFMMAWNQFLFKILQRKIIKDDTKYVGFIIPAIVLLVSCITVFHKI